MSTDQILTTYLIFHALFDGGVFEISYKGLQMAKVKKGFLCFYFVQTWKILILCIYWTKFIFRKKFHVYSLFSLSLFWHHKFSSQQTWNFFWWKIKIERNKFKKKHKNISWEKKTMKAMKVPIQDFKNTTIEESTKSYHSCPNYISWGEHLGYDGFDDIV